MANKNSIESLVSLNWDLYKHEPKKLLMEAAKKTKSMGSRYKFWGKLLLNLIA
jgi:hypothetical protein